MENTKRAVVCWLNVEFFKAYEDRSVLSPYLIRSMSLNPAGWTRPSEHELGVYDAFVILESVGFNED